MKNLWLLVVVVSVAVSVAAGAKCKCDCPRDQPVCGKDSSGDVFSFPSECALKCYNCTFDSDYRVTKRGACSDMDKNIAGRRVARKAGRFVRELVAKRNVGP